MNNNFGSVDLTILSIIYLLELVHGLRLLLETLLSVQSAGVWLVSQGGSFLLKQFSRIVDSLAGLGSVLGLKHRGHRVASGQRPERAAVTRLPLEHDRGFLLEFVFESLLIDCRV